MSENTENFEKLRLLADEGDEDELKEFISKLIANGLKVEVRSSEDCEFREDSNDSYTEVTQENSLLFNGECVYEWVDTFYGSWGGGGTGWWVEKSDSSLDFDVELILEKLAVDLKTPEVPRPDSEE